MNEFGFDKKFIPDVQMFFRAWNFSCGSCKRSFFKTGHTCYVQAGDQPNNALALNVLEPGEVAATLAHRVLFMA